MTHRVRNRNLLLVLQVYGGPLHSNQIDVISSDYILKSKRGGGLIDAPPLIPTRRQVPNRKIVIMHRICRCPIQKHLRRTVIDKSRQAESPNQLAGALVEKLIPTDLLLLLPGRKFLVLLLAAECVYLSHVDPSSKEVSLDQLDSNL